MKYDESFKYPRLYVEHDLYDQAVIALAPSQAHYLNNVMRKKDGEPVRLFNGRDGEWLGYLENLNKKSGNVVLKEYLKEQPLKKRRIHLLFTPIKKNRQDWLIEKAVELGVTDFHPVLTQNTEVRKINEERVTTQILEASEQCERFEIPKLHTLTKAEEKIASWPLGIKILSCLERYDAPALTDHIPSENQNIAFLIGPEGGFTRYEKEMIAARTQPVDLGETILRVETAVIKTLVLVNS